MKKIATIKGLCSRPLQQRYLAATAEERRELLEVVRKESSWMIEKMRGKGYRLEGTVGDIYGIFTRGQARGSIRLGEEAAVTDREPASTP
jgi:hypothetical protein